MSFLFKKRRARGGQDGDESTSPTNSTPTTPTTPTSGHSNHHHASDQSSSSSSLQRQNSSLFNMLSKKNSTMSTSSTPMSSTSSSTPTTNDDQLAKMYEELYMRQQGVDDDDDLVGVGGSTRRVNDNGDGGDDNDMDAPASSSSRHQKFLSFLNPLYKVSEEQLFNDFSFELGEIIMNENDLDYEEELSAEELYWKRKKEMEEERANSKRLRKMNVMDIVHVPVKLEVNPRKFLSYTSGDNHEQKATAATQQNEKCTKVQQLLQKLGDGTREEIVEDSKKEAMLAAMTESVMADELFETVSYSLDELMVWHIQRMEPVLLEEDDWTWAQFNTGDCYIVMKTFNAQNEDERLRVIYSWMGEEASWEKRAICAFLVQELRGKLTTGLKRLRMEKQHEESAEFRDLFKGHLKYEKTSFTDETIAVKPAFPAHQSSINAAPVAGSEPTLLVFSLKLNDDSEAGAGGAEPQTEAADDKRKKVNVNKFKIVVTRIPWNKRYSRDLLSQNEHNKQSAFIVNSSDKIYVWLGAQCLQPLQIKMIDTAKLIMYEEHRSQENIVVVETQGNESPEFLALLPESTSLPDYSHSMIRLDTVVYQVGLNEETKLIDVTPMKDFVLHADSFENHYCYLIETQYDVYGWMGRETLAMERRFLKRLLQEIRTNNGSDTGVLTCAFFHGYEPILFRERFSGYTMTETRESYESRRKTLSNICQKKLTVNTECYFDTYDQMDIEAERQKKLIDELDDGSGVVQVWRVIDFDVAEPVPEEEIGNFHTGECYLILYEFNRADVLYGNDDEEEEPEEEDEEGDAESEDEYKDYEYEDYEDEDDADYESRDLVKKSADVKNKRIAYLTRKILYCWEGAESEKKVAARILKENFHGYASDAINPAVVLTQYEGKESKHFMRVFEYIMTIHRGKSTDQRESHDSALYRVYYKVDPTDDTSYCSKAVEVERRKGSLNSNDIFILVATKRAFIWVGGYASTEYKKVAFKLAQNVIPPGRKVLAVDEDQESEEFWDDLGQLSVNDKYPEDKLNYECGNVHECTITSNGCFRVLQIGKVGDNFLQADLTDCHNPLIFDFSNTMFIWYPESDPDSTVRYSVRHALYKMTLLSSDDESKKEKAADEETTDESLPDFTEVCIAGREGITVYEETRGNESSKFKMIFPMWREYKTFIDHHALEKERAELDRAATIIQALPFLDILRRKHPYLMQPDEYVNIHNAVELVKIGLGAKTNSHIVIKELCALTDLYDFNNDLDKCDQLCSDLMRFCLTSIKKKNQAQQQTAQRSRRTIFQGKCFEANQI